MNAQQENFNKVLKIKDKLAEWKEEREGIMAVPEIPWTSKKTYAPGVVIETARPTRKKTP